MGVDRRIELARVADAPVLADMSRRLVEHGLRWRWTPTAIRRCIRHAETEVVVVRARTGQPLAFGIMRYEELEAHLILLAVTPGARRRGLGRHLVEYLESMARTAGIGRIILEVRAANAEARAFYRSMGYRESERLHGYYQGAEDALRMIADLWVGADLG